MSTNIPYEAFDDGIREAVRILAEAGVETFESCQGGEGHAYTEPTIRFHGERAEGLRALSIALQFNCRFYHLGGYGP